MIHLNPGDFVIQAEDSLLNFHQFNELPIFTLSAVYQTIDVVPLPLVIQFLDPDTDSVLAVSTLPLSIAAFQLNHTQVILPLTTSKKLKMKIVAPITTGVDIKSLSLIAGDTILNSIEFYTLSEADLGTESNSIPARALGFDTSYTPCTIEETINLNPYISSGQFAEYNPSTQDLTIQVPGIYEIIASIDKIPASS